MNYMFLCPVHVGEKEGICGGNLLQRLYLGLKLDGDKKRRKKKEKENRIEETNYIEKNREKGSVIGSERIRQRKVIGIGVWLSLKKKEDGSKKINNELQERTFTTSSVCIWKSESNYNCWLTWEKTIQNTNKWWKTNTRTRIFEWE